MKNREYKALAAMAMALTLVVGSIGTSHAAAFAKDKKAGQETTVKEKKEAQTTAVKAGNTAQNALKDETVYAKIDGNGEIQSVIVSDQLKNVTDSKRIRDISSLTDIKNVKGDEKFTKSEINMTWQGEGKNICYQGTTTKQLPVDVKISYQLDGKDIKAEELEGKSGHLVIRYAYENTTGTKELAYTPFLMATGIVLDDAKFTNITVKNGKVVSDGERNMVLGMGIPKMKEELGVKDLDIPDFFEVEADVTEYEAVKGITFATNDIFNQLDTDKFDDISDLQDSMKKLEDASNQLMNGSGELKKGLDTLLESSGTLTGGIAQLTDGAAALHSGVGTLADGSNGLAAGNKALADGTGQLFAGTKTLSHGAEELHIGLNTAADKTKNVLLTGVRQLDDGVAQMQKEVAAGVKPLGDGAAALHTSLGQIQEGTGALHAVLNQGTEQTGGVSLKGLAKQTAEDAAVLAGNLTLHVSASDVAHGNGGTEEAIEMLQALAQSNPELEEEIGQAVAKLNADQNARNEAAASMDTQMKAAADSAAIAGKVAQEAGMMQAIVGNLSDVAATVDNGMQQAKNGAAQLDAAVNDSKEGLGAKVTAGIGQLKQGTAALRNGVDGENGLAGGLEQLAKGAAAVSSGSSELSKKMGEADAGAKSAAAGAAQISGGAKELHAGTFTLYNGLNTLQNGSGALIDGVKKLDSGAEEWNKGMVQFHEDGIQKLVDVFEGDIDGMLEKFNHMLDASKAYKNFSGISDEMDGQVKFIFMTE